MNIIKLKTINNYKNKFNLKNIQNKNKEHKKKFLIIKIKKN